MGQVKAGVIICTRLSSSRLPAKAVRNIAGIPAIRHIVDRVIPTGIPIVIATPEMQGNQFMVAIGDTGNKVSYWQGKADSPLHRMAEVCKAYGFEYAVRITHDDILIDAQTVTDMLGAMTGKNMANVGYAYSPWIVEGAGVEIIHRDNLLYAAENRKEPTEFVSYFVRGPGMPKPEVYPHKPRQSICRPYRLTMDYPEDALVLDIVLGTLGKHATADQICRFIDKNQNILGWNRLPTITAYTCAYNAGEWIGEAVQSVLSAPINGLEYIVVDDGSTDNTLTEISKFSHDPRLKLLVNDGNRGLANASNRAISEAKGRYVMRLDADDMLMGESFADEWRAIWGKLEGGAVAVYPRFDEIDNDGEVLREHVDPRDKHHIGGAVFSKAWLNEVRFKANIRHWDGLELLARMRSWGERIEYSDAAPTWIYRVRNGSMSRSSLEERAKLRVEIEGGKIVTDKGG